MEKNSINLENYIYRKEDNKYYMYVGITKNKDNLTKMTNYFKNKSIDTSVKKFYISSTKFSESINNLDEIWNYLEALPLLRHLSPPAIP